MANCKNCVNLSKKQSLDPHKIARWAKYVFGFGLMTRRTFRITIFHETGSCFNKFLQFNYHEDALILYQTPGLNLARSLLGECLFHIFYTVITRTPRGRRDFYAKLSFGMFTPSKSRNTLVFSVTR